MVEELPDDISQWPKESQVLFYRYFRVIERMINRSIDHLILKRAKETLKKAMDGIDLDNLKIKEVKE